MTTEIALPRVVNVFTKPLTGYAASLQRNLREPLRDVSYMSASPVSGGYDK